MPIVQIEHPVPNFDEWKRAFDSDPVGRKASGVVRYRILQPIDRPNYVLIELELESEEQAELFLAKLRGLWSRVDGTVMYDPAARIVRVIETVQL